MAFLLLLLCILLLLPPHRSTKPHIVFMLADDIGWADFGFRTPEYRTPHLDHLHATGISLDIYYVQPFLPLCTPTRAALLTGRYPIRQGLQHLVLTAAEARSLPLQELALPQVLKTAGYQTHLVGKWHLGFYRWEATPTFRGFDSFYGFYNGMQDYYSHRLRDGYDFRDNTVLDREADGRYATDLYTQRATDIIARHPSDQPLFLLLAHQAPHCPAQAPERFLRGPHAARFANDSSRTIYAGMLRALDSVGQVIQALKKKGLWNSTILVFSSDNGGPVPGDIVGMNIGASNFPLRGGKFSLTEGGVRATGMLHGGFLASAPRRFTGLMHVTDWFPTLAAAAGIQIQHAAPLDGLNFWQALRRSGTPSPRTEVLLNVDPYAVPQSNAAVRRGKWKLIVGHPGYPDGWWQPPSDHRPWPSQPHPPCTGCTPHQPDYVPTKHKGVVQLYNIPADPTERYDLAALRPDVVEALFDAYERYAAQAVPAPNRDIHEDARAYPRFHNLTWTPWVEPSAEALAVLRRDERLYERGRQVPVLAVVPSAALPPPYAPAPVTYYYSALLLGGTILLLAAWALHSHARITNHLRAV